MKLIYVTLLFLLLMQAFSEANAKPVEVHFPITIKNQENLTKEESQILNKIEFGEAVESSQILDARIAIYTKQYNEKHATKHTPVMFKNMLKKTSVQDHNNNSASFKLELDERIREDFGHESIKYNAAISNPLEFFMNGRGQCTSSSICYSMAKSAKLDGDEFKNENTVRYENRPMTCLKR